GRLVVGDAVRLDLRERQATGDVDRHVSQAQLFGRLPPGVADDDYPGLVHHDRLAETELADGGGHRADGVIIVTWVVGVGTDRVNGPQSTLIGAFLTVQAESPP